MDFENSDVPQNKIEVEKTEGEKKIAEYTSRILNGENSSYVLDGLPESWLQKINEAVNSNLEVIIG